ncbi:MAG TPA: glycosyltransferase family 9 protein [Ohtaekwangia sp.]|nr:glycosyltransferase family 9 protein [Ohtaekwangia sp.]
MMRDPHVLYFHENHIRRIAVFRALYLGDMLCIIPAIRALRKAYPDAEITLIGLPWQQEFVDRFSAYFDRFIAFPGWPGLPEQTIDPHRVTVFLAAIQDKKFDLVLQWQGNGSITNSMVGLWGAKHIAGLRRENEYCPDEALFPVSEDSDHEVLRFFKVIQALNIPEQGSDLEFPILDDEWSQSNTIARALTLAAGAYVCIHPGARDPKRRWSVENFAAVADHLKCLGFEILLTGSGQELELLDRLESRMHVSSLNLVRRAGHVSMGVLAALVKNSALLVSNDTGISHVAAAIGVPSVVIFSRYSDPGRWRPLNEAIHSIVPAGRAETVDEVMNIVLQKLGSIPRASLLLHQK